MSVVLQQLDVSFAEPAEPTEPVEPAEPAEPAAVEHVEPPEPVVSEPPAKKRGRPPKVKAEAPGLPPVPQKPPPKAKAPKPKAPKPKAPPPESDSSDVDETLRNVYNHVAKPDMQTAILEFLVDRKNGETQKRRQLWGQLAQM